MQKKLVSKVLEALKKTLETDREKYRSFFQDFGAVLKEGIYHGVAGATSEDDTRKEVARIALFASTGEGQDTTLAEYIERMPVSQKAIYYLAGEDRATLARSPHLEAFKKKGFEVLLLTDPVDEFAFSRLREFEGRELKSAERGGLDFETTEDKDARAKNKASLQPVAEALKGALKDRVGDVRFGDRLTDSVAVLVTDEHGLTPQMLRVLKESKQNAPENKRILELNPDHPLIKKLDAIKDDSGRVADFAEILLGQALVAEGQRPEDPVRFNQLVTRFMLGE